MNNKVYLVLIGWQHEGFNIEGVFFDKQKAEILRDSLEEKRVAGDIYIDYVDLDEFEVQ